MKAMFRHALFTGYLIGMAGGFALGAPVSASIGMPAWVIDAGRLF